MKKAIGIAVWAGLIILLVGCSAAQAQSGAHADVTPTPVDCPDPASIVKAFYDANNAAQFDASLALLADDATLDSWAQGINGHHMIEKHLVGKDQIRAVLGNPGLRRNSDQPNSPIYHETGLQVSGNKVDFALEPDRAHPDGRPYNPYAVEIVFEGCKIKSLTVIERVMWL
jgi:ketosteroid isomerase-like protein